MTTRRNNLIVICLDGVGAGWLGPYGNTWCQTPAWNAIAGESVLFEFAYASGPKLDDSYHDYWSGKLSALASERRASLISDDGQVVALSGADPFHERILLEPDRVQEAAESVEETQVAQTLAAAANWIAEPHDEPFLLWLHASGLYGPWDAPYELRCLASDEDDPDPPEFVEPPARQLPSDYDPDELLGYMQAHSGQITATDQALGAFLQAVDGLAAMQDAVVIFTAPRGYALGEHGWIGGQQALFGELLQVPCLIRFPDRRWAAQRSDRMLKPQGVLEIADAWSHEEADEGFVNRLGLGHDVPDHQQIAICQLDERRAIRTPGWFLSQTSDGDVQLYAKPDDRWEANEVSDRCPDAVQELLQLLEQHRAAAEAGESWEPALSDLLRNGYE